MRDRASSLKKIAPNVDLPALVMGCVASAIGLVPMLCALDIIHQPESAFPSGRTPAFIGGLVFLTGGLFLAIGRGLGSTKLFKACRKPLVSFLVAIMVLSFAAIPASMLALGTVGTIRIRGPFVSWTFHSPVLDKFVLSFIFAICAGLAILCFVDFVKSLKQGR
jgi:hypothetical protein